MTLRDRIRTLNDAHGEKLRFLVVGVVNTAFSIALYNIALTVTSPIGAAMTASAVRWISWIGEHFYIVVYWATWVIAVVWSTTTMKYFAFRSPGNLWRQVGKAYFIYLPAQAISTGVLWLAVRVLHLSPRIGQLMAIVITTVLSYLGHKYFTFRAPVELDETIEHDLLPPHEHAGAPRAAEPPTP